MISSNFRFVWLSVIGLPFVSRKQLTDDAGLTHIHCSDKSLDVTWAVVIFLLIASYLFTVVPIYCYSQAANSATDVFDGSSPMPSTFLSTNKKNSACRRLITTEEQILRVEIRVITMQHRSENSKMKVAVFHLVNGLNNTKAKTEYSNCGLGKTELWRRAVDGRHIMAIRSAGRPYKRTRSLHSTEEEWWLTRPFGISNFRSHRRKRKWFSTVTLM